MKRYKDVVVYISLIFVICVILCFKLLNNSDVSVDPVLFNDIAKSAEENFDHLEELDTIKKKAKEGKITWRI